MKKITFLIIFSMTATSTEVDNFNDRDPTLRDVRLSLNQLVSAYMMKAVETANQKKSCEFKTIENSLIDEFGGLLGRLFWSKIENDIERSPYIDKRRSNVNQSIYADVNLFESFILQVANLGFTLRIGQFFIGSDKLGHFFYLGHDYFERVYKKGGSLDAALSYGEETERTYFGLESTGVYSHGDLASNFDGLRYWERIANINLPKGVSPYFTCTNNTWKQITPFDWIEYVTDAWDEAINCNRFKNTGMRDKVEARSKLKCPIARESCRTIIRHYGSIAPRLISEKCYEM